MSVVSSNPESLFHSNLLTYLSPSPVLLPDKELRGICTLKGVGHEMNILQKAYKRKFVLSVYALMVFGVHVAQKIKYKDFLCFYENTYKF